MKKREIALILAGGRGKRMDILCNLRPKPALPIAGNFRVIDFTLSNCIHSQLTDIAVLVDYERQQMSQYVEEWHRANSCDANLQVLPPGNGSYSGTADAVRQNLAYLEERGSETALILAGDHVYKMDYGRMIAFHNMMKADATIAVVRVPMEQAQRFGTVTVDSGGKISDFQEKSISSRSNLASMGIYVFNMEILAKRLNEDAQDPASIHDFGYNILPRMVNHDRVFAYEFKGYWHDIGTIEAYYEANMEYLSLKPGVNMDGCWSILNHSRSSQALRDNNGDNIINSLISPGCVIKGRVENSILSPGVHVAEQAAVINSVVMTGTHIGYHSIVNRCILDEKANIGKFCYVGLDAGMLTISPEITVLGKSVTVPDYTAISSQCRNISGAGSGVLSTQLVTSGAATTPA